MRCVCEASFSRFIVASRLWFILLSKPVGRRCRFCVFRNLRLLKCCGIVAFYSPFACRLWRCCFDRGAYGVVEGLCHVVSSLEAVPSMMCLLMCLTCVWHGIVSVQENVAVQTGAVPLLITSVTAHSTWVTMTWEVRNGIMSTICPRWLEWILI